MCDEIKLVVLLVYSSILAASAFISSENKNNLGDDVIASLSTESLQSLMTSSDYVTSHQNADQNGGDNWCYSCSSHQADSACMNGSLLQQKHQEYQQICSADQRFCRVHVYKSVVALNATDTRTSVWYLERSCARLCQRHEDCLVVGERTKIISCTTCCQGRLCNHGNAAEPLRIGTGSVIMLMMVVMVTKSFVVVEVD